MLAHSPPLPIVIDHFHTDNGDCTPANDVEGIMLALKHRDRVRRIRLKMSISMENVFVLIDGEFPMLEYLCIGPIYNMRHPFPKTFQAPQLRHLISFNSTYPIGSPLLSAAIRLVTLSLVNIPLSTYFQPDELLHRVSLMPQLEILWIAFDSFYSRHYANLGVTDMHNATHISLLHLRYFQFGGFNAYSEALLSRIAAPHLEVVRVSFWEKPPFSVLSLLQFMSTSQHLKLGSAILVFDVRETKLSVYPHRTARLSVFDMFIEGSSGHNVSDAAQILNVLSPLLSLVIDLTLDHKDNPLSPELENEAEPTNWRILLRSFNNVKTLFAANGVVEKLSRSLQLDDGESPDDLLPELKELAYSPSNDYTNAFDGFVDARQHAGHPVTLVDLKNAVSTPLCIRGP